MKAETGAGDAQTAFLRIGELARRVDVSPEVLRAWERRYQLLKPARTAGGFRLYSNADEARVRSMQAHMERGLSAAQAARAALSERAGTEALEPSSQVPPVTLEGERRALADSLSSYDEAAAQAAIDRLLARLSLDTVLADVVIPLLREVGEGWEAGSVSVGQEHFASHVIRGRLMALARGWDQGLGPRAVLACAPGERHDLGLVCHALALRGRGWRISYMGADTPVAAIDETVDVINPAAVVVVAEMENRLEPHTAELAALSAKAILAIGGRGTDAVLAERLGAVYLAGSPVAAADTLTLRIAEQGSA